MGGRLPMTQGLLLLSAGCDKPMFDNAGGRNSLLEDREACDAEPDRRRAGSARGTLFCASLSRQKTEDGLTRIIHDALLRQSRPAGIQGTF